MRRQLSREVSGLLEGAELLVSGAPDSHRDFRRAKMRRRAAAKSTSAGTSGTKRQDFRQPELLAHAGTFDYQKSINYVQVFVR